MLNSPSTCIGCGSKSITMLEEQNKLLTCNTCGLIFTTELSAQNYQDAYFGADTLYSEHLSLLDRFQEEQDINKFLLPFERRILELIYQRHKTEHVVDVGCGTGRFLRAVREISLSATGYEVADVLVQRLQHHGLNVVRGGIVDFLAAKDQPCDVLCLLEVMEHLETPGQLIRDIMTTKKPKFLYVVVPNYRVRRFYDGRFACHDVPPNHLSWWGESSLEKLLSMTGYEVHVESIPECRRSLLSHLYRKLRGNKSESCLTAWINAFINPPTFWLLGVAEKQ